MAAEQSGRTEQATYKRYRARVGEWTGELMKKREHAIRNGVDYALAQGVVIIEDVPVRRKMTASYEPLEDEQLVGTGRG